ncbi:MAG: glycosyltransferase family 9 protein [Nitrospirota bacterium]
MIPVRDTCRFYRGHIPCKFHKLSGEVCETCGHADELRERILIIKLGAIGDVIRTTPLLRKLKELYPHAEITWLTYSPDIVPKDWVDTILDFSLQNIVWLEGQQFDWLINLDKDREAIALAERLSARQKTGFKMNHFGKCIPISNKAEKQKWLTGLRDDLNKSNTRNYMEEIFSLCGYDFTGEEYILSVPKHDAALFDTSKKIVGLNTGCGSRWPTRLWPEKNWEMLARLLHDQRYKPILLGGPQEEEKNIRLSQATGALYCRTPSLNAFIGIVNSCDVIVSQVTMAMHVAIALKKHLVLLNNIFNKHEFYLYGRGDILEPSLDCLGCFKQQYDQRCKVKNCMELISVVDVVHAVQASAGAPLVKNRKISASCEPALYK